ncbi:hypothetical protein BCR44DRAFT_1437306 [Catenaria anguillulae PL171]|uniref:Uncharacterized protein n=1 Tax=Catenaria anguillulae PL171 TaxID=765915 RepID=A0A1Y2HJ82_9FUNG|nr:hypothetical protein BCR44DRAFT_1437306 [Catenaria anguillulae PL171]
MPCECSSSATAGGCAGAFLSPDGDDASALTFSSAATASLSALVSSAAATPPFRGRWSPSKSGLRARPSPGDLVGGAAVGSIHSGTWLSAWPLWRCLWSWRR